MKQLSTNEKLIVLGYIEEMLDIFNTVLIEEFKDGEEPNIICNGSKFLKRDFESLKIKFQNL
ncbi:hypothetical protein C671_0728 [[Clostridium] bifermentans ATCC 19299]|uniref:hypothetical protein n=1 Tax=Paraclostridium bifermentans TaxID=1490 RepID=UPI00038DBC31|nr:hypothetical protein [Paraclostridium bifermentans]EQK47241.1 hypothetical protein C671_0728 [[Clostridium] bifermentans ATCC 19299] [Paraclostridium bifermentans ATCC 19299]